MDMNSSLVIPKRWPQSGLNSKSNCAENRSQAELADQ